MNPKLSQKEKALQLHRLHYANELLILPNIWDVLGAKLLESLGYPAIATASASIALSNGYPDGENIPFDELLFILMKIAGSLQVPLTADIESGYADNLPQLESNIKRLIHTGIAGINIEDTHLATNQLYSIEKQCERISLIRRIADDMEIPLFINARADVLLHKDLFVTAGQSFEELKKRGLAYKAAGANGFYPITLKEKTHIRKLAEALGMPINILTIPGIPELHTLKETGVARLSLGPSFLKTAVKAMKGLAFELNNGNGLANIINNEISSDELKVIISR